MERRSISASKQEVRIAARESAVGPGIEVKGDCRLQRTVN
jgi:hypothetical protein